MMRGSVVAFRVTVKSWLICIGSVPQLACFALFPLVVVSLFGGWENQAFLSAINSVSRSSDNTPSPSLTTVLHPLWIDRELDIRPLVASPEQAQPETAVFADMQLRYDSITPFDGLTSVVSEGPAAVDPTPTGMLPAVAISGTATAKRAADALIDRAMGFAQGGFVAENLARRALSLSPDSFRARFVLGKILANRDDENGVEMLMQAADHDPRLIENIRPAVTAFAKRHAASAYAQRSQAIIEDWARVADLAVAERNTLSAASPLLPSELDDASIGAMRGCLPTEESMNSARLVRKSVSRWVALPAYFVILDTGDETQRAAISACIASLNLDATVAVLLPAVSGQPAPEFITDRDVVLNPHKS
jgi:hypothetical protein